jgi:hypothetical protein
MQENIQILLIDYLDRRLEGDELAAAEQLLRNDVEAGNYWNNLLLAKEAIEYAGLYDQVANVRDQFKQITPVRQMPAQKAVVRTLVKNVYRVAAVFVLLIGAAIVYKFVAVTPAGVYNDNYAAYDLNTSRGENAMDQIERAYRAKDWTGVLTAFNAAAVKNNKALFLAGMADMELKKYADAANTFGQIMVANAQSGEEYFQEEAEYYQAMAYLAENQSDKALPALKKIRDNKAHMYHQKVAEMSWIDLKVLSAKE